MADDVQCRCGATVPHMPNGAVHRYLDAVPGCWALYGEVLARRNTPQSLVDAYALQHPGIPSLQTIQSAAVHLISLYHQLELGTDSGNLLDIMRAATEHKSRFVWLEPPSNFGKLTIVYIHTAADTPQQITLADEWAQAVWQAWSAHHEIIREWAAATWHG